MKLLKTVTAVSCALAATAAFGQTKPAGPGTTQLDKLAKFLEDNHFEFGLHINAGYGNYRAKGAAIPTRSGGLCGSAATPVGCNFDSRNGIYDNRSSFAIRGHRNLDGEARVFFQVESGFNIDSGQSSISQNGSTPPPGGNGLLASLDSFIGFESPDWGRVRAGRMGIWWSLPGISAHHFNYWDSVPQRGAYHGMGVVAGPSQRQSNTIEYRTPRFKGMNIAASYSPAAETASTTGGATNTDADVWGLRLTGAWKPVRIQADWAVRSNITATVPTFTAGTATTPPAGAASLSAAGRSKIEGLRLAGRWDYNDSGYVSFGGSRLTNTNVVGMTPGSPALTACQAGTGAGLLAGGGCWARGDNLRLNVFFADWVHRITPNTELALQLGWNGDVKGSTGNMSDSGSRAINVGGRYFLDKKDRKSWVYVSYSTIRNGANSYADFQRVTPAITQGFTQGAGSGFSSTSSMGGNSSGADPRNLAVGVVYNF